MDQKPIVSDGEDSPVLNSTRNKAKLFKRRLKKNVVSDSDDEGKQDLKSKLLQAANSESDSNSIQKKKTATASSTKKNFKEDKENQDDQDQKMSEEDQQELKPRKIRRIKRNIDKTQLEGLKSVANHSDDESSLAPQNKSDEDEFEPTENRLQKMKKKILKGPTGSDGNKKERNANRKKKADVDLEDPKDTFNFDDVSQDSEDQQLGKKGGERKVKKEKQARKKKAPKNDNLGNSVNYVKTSNKLIGDIVNNDLYDSDEGMLADGFYSKGGANREYFNDNDEMRGGELDFGPSKKEGDVDAKDKDMPLKGNEKFLQKMKIKKDQQEQDYGIEQDIVNLGFVQNLAKKVSANELAANGIQLSVRQNLVNFIRNMDKEKVTQNEQKLLTALSSQTPEEKLNKVQDNSKDQIRQLEVEKVSSLVLTNEPPEKDDETGGLIFYDPKAEARSQKEKELEEAQRNRQNLQKDQSIANSMVAQQAGRTVNARQNMLNQLKNNRLKEKSKMVNLEYLVQCKKVTDFDDSKQKTRKNGSGEDDIIEDESNDSEFNEDEALKEQADAGQLWDDEENFIGDKDQGEEGEEEQNDDVISVDQDAKKQAVQDSQSFVCSEIDLNEIDGKMLALTSNDGDSDGSIVQRRRREVKQIADAVKKSHESSQVEINLKQRKKIKMKQYERVAGFFDNEAELGSDDENKDEIKKQINKDDAEENEDGLDSDLDGFVDNRDEKEIGDPEHDAEEKFLQDLAEDDKQKTRIAMQAALFGQNRKRKRGQVEGLTENDLNEFQQRKKERMEQREEELKGDSQNDEELEQHLLEGGKNRAIQHMQIKQMQEEDDLSDDEIQNQMEHNRYYSFMRQKAKKDQIKEMEKRQNNMDAELGNFMNDITEDKGQNMHKSAFDSTNSGTNSKKSIPTLGSKGSTIPGSQKFLGSSLMINQKKVTIPKSGNDLKLSTTQSTSVNPADKKKSYVPGNSMAAFFKQSTQDRFSSHASGQNLKASTKAQNSVPMIFKQRKPTKA